MKKGNKDQESPSIEERIEELKKKGVIPSDTKVINEIKEEDVGKPVVFRATVEQVGIRMSPPVVVIGEIEGETYDTGYTTKLLDVEVKFEKNHLLATFEDKKKRSEALSFFNTLISIFNIVGVSFDFVSDSEIIVFMKGLKRKVQAISSATAQRRGVGMNVVEIDGLEFSKIVLAIWALWRLIRKSDYFRDNDLYQLLGYCRYHYFHKNYFLSFVHGWLFLEAMINMMWMKLMNGKFARKSPTESEREWTCMIKIDELCMLDEIDEDLREVLHKLRKKRNAVFHVDPKVAKREVTGDDCLETIKAGLAIFYKLIGSPWGDDVIEFRNMGKLMYVAIHGPPQKLTLK